MMSFFQTPKQTVKSQKNLVEVRRRFELFGAGWDARGEDKPFLCPGRIQGDDALFWRNGYEARIEADARERKAIAEIQALEEAQ
jgi:hypothetical protein